MADRGGLQLLPQTRRKIEVRTPGQNKYLVLSFALVGIMVVGYFTLYTYRSSLFDQAAAIDTKLADIERQRNKDVENRLLNFNQQLATVRPLLDSHIIWSRALQRIQSLVHPNVQFQSMTGDFNKKTFNFKAVANNYTTVARQVSAFYAEPTITDIAINKIANLPSSRVEFDMQLTVDVNKFLRNQLAKPIQKP